MFVNKEFGLQLSGFSTPHDKSDSADRSIAATVAILGQSPREFEIQILGPWKWVSTTTGSDPGLIFHVGPGPRHHEHVAVEW